MQCYASYSSEKTPPSCNPVQPADEAELLLTYPQCALLRDFRVATLFPDGQGKVQLIPAPTDTFSAEAICGHRKIGWPPEALLKRTYFRCDDCGQDSCVCFLETCTLILDTPVCRDGSVEDRARFTLRWPLVVNKSKIQIGKGGVFTQAQLPTHLLFGPYEGVYKPSLCDAPGPLEADLKNFVQVLDDFIDSSNPSLCNWLCFVAMTPLKYLANCAPIVYKGTVFFKTIKTIPSKTELLLWTGHERVSFQNPTTNGNTCHDSRTSKSLDTSLQCSWCKLQFWNEFYLRDHQSRCSLSKLKPIKHEDSQSLDEMNGHHLLRSKRTAMKSTRSCSLLTPSPSPNELNVSSAKAVDAVKKCQASSISNGFPDSTLKFPSFFCPDCGIEFNEKTGFERHIEEHHRCNQRNLYSETKAVEPIQDKSLSEPTQLPVSPIFVEEDYNYHLGNETCVFDLPWVRTLLKMNRAIRQNNSTSLRCSSCHMQFFNHFGAAIHEHSCMDGQRPYKCGHCGKRFQLYFSVVKHMIRHEDAEKEILATLISTYKIEEAPHPENDLLNKDSNEGDVSIFDYIGFHKSNNPSSHGETAGLTSESDTIKRKSMNDDDGSLTFVQQSRDLNFVGTRKKIGAVDGTSTFTTTTNMAKNIEQSVCFVLDDDPKLNPNNNEEDKFYIDSSQFTTAIDVSDSIYGGRRRRHECCICGQRFYRRKHIKKHMELHQNETHKVYKCSYCNRWFGCLEIVKYHEKSFHDSETKHLISDCFTGEQSFLRKLLTVLAKEGAKGKYSEYFNAKRTIKDKKFKCEICSKRFTSFYRVRKHKIVSHTELMDLLEATNGLAAVSEDNLKESNILTVLSSIKEDAVKERMPANCKENATPLPETSDNQPILLTVFENNVEEILPNKTMDTIQHSPNKKLSVDASSSEMSTQSTYTKNQVIEVQKVSDSETISEKTTFPNAVEFDQICYPTSAKDMVNSDTINRVKYSFSQTGSGNQLKRLNNTKLPSQSKVGCQKMTQHTLSMVSLKNTKPQPSILNEKATKQCKVCGKKLSSKTNMKGHLRSHTGERHYECQYCHKRYSLLSTLKRHLRIHNGYRPFKCDFCERTYTQSSNLKRHHRQHTGERPFRCPFCPRKYAEKFSLNRHMKKHKETKIHKCQICAKEFSAEYLLTWHYKESHK